MSLGWIGKQVRNSDGRTGVIRAESYGSCSCGLSIAVDGGDDDYVQLNMDSKDSGSHGWAWLCENFLGNPAWLPLGDHNT
jgi:hypothetical protein